MPVLIIVVVIATILAGWSWWYVAHQDDVTVLGDPDGIPPANVNTVVNGNTNTALNVNAPINQNTNASTAGWKKYTNTKLALNIQYPANSFTTPNETDAYIRIQNYTTETDKLTLSSKDYYLEIYPQSTTNCKENIENPINTSFGVLMGFRGNRLPGGDAGGLGVVGCVVKNNNNITVVITGGESNRALVNQILSTLTFTK